MRVWPLLLCGMIALIRLGMLAPETWAAPPAAFAPTYLSEESTKHHPSAETEVRKALAGKQLVFVAGVLNELAPSYFSDTLEVLERDYGIRDATVIVPHSFTSMEENGRILAQRFAELHDTSGRPLVIVSHSKGAAETLLALLGTPELIEKGIVEKIYSLQGAFNGSPVADLLNGTGKLKGWQKVIEKTMPGIRNLGRDSAKAVIGKAMGNASKELLASLGARLFYIRSQQDPLKTVFYMNGCALYLASLRVANDGVLVSDDQKVENLGTDLGVVEGIDHTDFVVPFPYSSKLAHVRAAFTHALVRSILGLE